MTKSQKQLLWVAAVLAVLQFIVKPVLSWQEEVKTEATLKLERLERSKQLLANADELTAAATTAQTMKEELLAQFPVAVESSMLQIQLQGEIETLLRGQRVRVEQFNWMTGLEPVNSSLQGLRAKVILSGRLPQLVQTHLQLMQQMPTVQHESIEIRGSNTRRSEHRLTLTLFVPVQRGGQA
ncbi:hypothetical protein [Pseudidiomarina insulisalsae]|uniref:Type II secretory pathway component n=1 Tax=Pseudidiomarina insulisalsae TaxID=575789 RepID=A0A432YNT3_9GAMM|nr:hypothetical protein [Pseudidiomarina insulisalsae]RUO62603.1 hypothetical protein CWI71_04000 [Pseudidiomarina insulisalsae]